MGRLSGRGRGRYGSPGRPGFRRAFDQSRQDPGAAGRAGETIVLLASGLIGSLTVLIPRETNSQLGLWLLLLWIPTWLLPTGVQIRDFRHRRYYRAHHAVVRFVLFQAATLPLLVAALSLEASLTGGLQWFALSLILSLMLAIFNAWVLLVEIVR